MHILIRNNAEGNREVLPNSDAGLRAITTSLRLAVLAVEKGDLQISEQSWLQRRRYLKTAHSLADTGTETYDSFARHNTLPGVAVNGNGVRLAEQAKRLYVPGFKIDCEVGLELLPLGAPLAIDEEQARYERAKNWKFTQPHTLLKAELYNEQYLPVLERIATEI